MKYTFLLFLVVILSSCKLEPSTHKSDNTTDTVTQSENFLGDCNPKKAQAVKTIPPNRELTYNNKPVIITRHAKCRMKCRYIDKNEVNQIIKTGSINRKKSDPNPSNPRHCPSKAYEGCSSDGQHIRVIMAECDRNAKLVTIIDLENNYQCSCK